jgi:hypothetical protein
MRGVITTGKLIVMGVVVFGLSGIGWAQTYSDKATATTEAGQIQALAQAFQVSPQAVEALRAKHAAMGGQAWDAVASHLTQAQPAAYTEPVAFPRHAVQVRALAQTFQVSPQAIEVLWAKHAAMGGQAWDAVASHLTQAQPAAYTEPVAFPRHAVQVRGLAQAFQVSDQVIEALWEKHAAKRGQAWDAVAMHLAEAQASRQTNQIVASTNY